MAEPQTPEEILHALEESQSSHELTIIKLSAPITNALADASNSNIRTSNGSAVSADAFSSPSPASLEADLTHYKELFSKLRFSYLEQVTKERFLRAIISDPPLIVSSAENYTFETSLLAPKAALKAHKTTIAELLQEIEATSRLLANKYEYIQLQTAQLRDLPEQIKGLEESIGRLRREQGPSEQDDGNPNMHLGLDRTLELVGEKEMERAELERKLESLRGAVPRKVREAERANEEVEKLGVKREGTMAAAGEARRRKEAVAGGRGDELEERGRWWRGVEMGVKGMLQVED